MKKRSPLFWLLAISAVLVVVTLIRAAPSALQFFSTGTVTLPDGGILDTDGSISYPNG